MELNINTPAKFELDINEEGIPCIRFLHFDRSSHLEQKLLGRFVELASKNGLWCRGTVGHLKCGTNESYEQYIIEPKPKEDE